MAINLRDSYSKVKWDLASKRLDFEPWGKTDDTGRGIIITLVQNSVIITPSTETIRMWFQKPDGTDGYIAATLEGGKFYIENMSQVFAVPGIVYAEFEINQGTEFVRSMTFSIMVYKSNKSDVIVSSNDYSALQAALGEFGSLKQEFEEVIAGVTVDAEVINARGGKVNLDARLDGVDTSLAAVQNRVDDIITTPVPVGEVIAQEIIDARQGEGSIGANISWVKSQLMSNGNYLFNSAIGLRKWRRALADIKSGNTVIYDIVIHGDSNADGAGLPIPDWITKGFVAQFKDRIKALYGDVGSGFIEGRYPFLEPSLYWTLNGAWADGGGISGFSLNTYSLATNVPGESATITFEGTGVKVLLTKTWWTGDVQISVDGGASETISTYFEGDAQGIWYTKTGLVDGEHTITITNVTQTILNGITPLKGTAGIRVNNIGRFGLATGAAFHPHSLRNAKAFAPILTIIPLISNDYGGQNPIADYKNLVQAAITQALTYGDCLLFSVGTRTDDTSNPIKQMEYVNAMADLSILNNCAFLDLYGKWGCGKLANEVYGYIADGVHPTLAGHTDIANMLIGALL